MNYFLVVTIIAFIIIQSTVCMDNDPSDQPDEGNSKSKLYHDKNVKHVSWTNVAKSCVEDFDNLDENIKYIKNSKRKNDTRTLEEKVSALKRVKSGESIEVISMDLKTNSKNITNWIKREDSIMFKYNTTKKDGQPTKELPNTSVYACGKDACIVYMSDFFMKSVQNITKDMALRLIINKLSLPMFDGESEFKKQHHTTPRKLKRLHNITIMITMRLYYDFIYTKIKLNDTIIFLNPKSFCLKTRTEIHVQFCIDKITSFGIAEEAKQEDILYFIYYKLYLQQTRDLSEIIRGFFEDNRGKIIEYCKTQNCIEILVPYEFCDTEYYRENFKIEYDKFINQLTQKELYEIETTELSLAIPGSGREKFHI